MHFGCIRPATQQMWLGRSGRIAGTGWSKLCTGFKHKAKQGKHWAQHKVFPSCSDFTLYVMKLLVLHISRCLTLFCRLPLWKSLSPLSYMQYAICRDAQGMNQGLIHPSLPFSIKILSLVFFSPFRPYSNEKQPWLLMSAAGNNNTWATPALQFRKQQHLLCGSEGSQGPTLPTPPQLCTSWITSWVLLPLLRPWKYPCHLWKLFMSSVQQCTD